MGCHIIAKCEAMTTVAKDMQLIRNVEFFKGSHKFDRIGRKDQFILRRMPDKGRRRIDGYLILQGLKFFHFLGIGTAKDVGIHRCFKVDKIALFAFIHDKNLL